MRSVVRNPGLGSRLKAYRESVRSRPEIDWTAKLGSWPTYAAAAGSALAMATGASANTIQYSGIQNVTVTQIAAGSANANIIGIDIDGLGHYFSLELRNQTGQFVCPGRSSGAFCNSGSTSGTGQFLAARHVGFLLASSSGVVFDDPSSAIALNFNLASNINRGLEDRLGIFHGSDTSVGNIGHFVPGQPGFAGIRLGANQYGWIRLSLSNDSSGHVQSMTAIDWAINTDGGILAGQTSNESSPTPEPNSGAMALLAAGSAGVLAWRRRQNAGN
jgi:hypothetical protein